MKEVEVEVEMRADGNFLIAFFSLLFSLLDSKSTHLDCSDRGLEIELQDRGASRPNHERRSRQRRVVELDDDFVVVQVFGGVFGGGGGLLMVFFKGEN